MNELLEEHLVRRETFKWGTYGKSGKDEYKQVKLCDMSNSHIEAILETQPHIYVTPRHIPAILNFELGYRAGVGIYLEDK